MNYSDEKPEIKKLPSPIVGQLAHLEDNISALEDGLERLFNRIERVRFNSPRTTESQLKEEPELRSPLTNSLSAANEHLVRMIHGISNILEEIEL